jgi:hypothetical protein
MSDYRQGYVLDIGFIDHYTHDSELQAIAPPPLVSKIHKSPQYPLSPSSLLSAPAVPWQRLLTVEILQLHALKSYHHELP